jgi:ABC-type branched-subunit amino acid transport system permease subunit
MTDAVAAPQTQKGRLELTLRALVLGCLLAVYVFLRRLLWSPFGRALSGIRVNEHRMRALGFNTFSHKLAAFTLVGNILLNLDEVITRE